MLLLPLQSAWALMATPCAGLVYVPQSAVSTVAPDHEHIAGHQHEAEPAHDHEHAGKAQTSGEDNCSGSAACMSLHAPPLAHAPSTGLPAVTLPGVLAISGLHAFTSAPQVPLHRPPISLLA